MRIEKEGFVLHLEGTWCEISNKYAVLESGDVAVNEEDIPAGFAERNWIAISKRTRSEDMERLTDA